MSIDLRNPLLQQTTIAGTTRDGEACKLTVREVSVGELPRLLDAIEKLDDAAAYALVKVDGPDVDALSDDTLAEAMMEGERLNFPKLARWTVRHAASVIRLANLVERLIPYGSESSNCSTTSQPKPDAPKENLPAKQCPIFARFQRRLASAVRGIWATISRRRKAPQAR